MSMGHLYKVHLPPSPTTDEPGQGPSGAGQTQALMFSGARIPRGTFKVLSLADDVLREAEAAADQIRMQASAVVEQQRQEAHALGFAQGRTQAVAVVLGTLEVERRLRELLSHRLADIVEHCVRNLLGDIGEPRLMRQRILHLLATAGTQAMPMVAAGTQDPGLGTVTLYVCPEQAPLAQQMVAELSQGASGVIAGLVVVADPRRAPDSLLLETRVSFLDSDLTLSLQETRALVQDALTHALTVLGSPA